MVRVKSGHTDFQITKDNVDHLLPSLEQLIQPGKPIMVEQVERRNLSKTTTKHLFYSDGTFKDKKFVSKKGKKQSVYATCDCELNLFNNYNLVACWQENQEVTKLVMPWSHKGTEIRENTFSPAGPSLESTFSSGGTKTIILGDDVYDLFPDTLNSIKFAEGSYKFNLDPFYSSPGNCVDQAGLNNEQNTHRN